MVIRKVKQLARLYVRAWRVRIHDIPQGPAPAAIRPRALSITAPSGGTGACLTGAAVSEASTREITVEEACRRSLSPKQFFIAETVRGVQRWRSGTLHSRAEAKKALECRAQIYTAQGCQAKHSRDCRTVRFAGTTIEIRIVRDEKKEAA